MHIHCIEPNVDQNLISHIIYIVLLALTQIIRVHCKSVQQRETIRQKECSLNLLLSSPLQFSV